MLLDQSNGLFLLTRHPDWEQHSFTRGCCEWQTQSQHPPSEMEFRIYIKCHVEGRVAFNWSSSLGPSTCLCNCMYAAHVERVPVDIIPCNALHARFKAKEMKQNQTKTILNRQHQWLHRITRLTLRAAMDWTSSCG